MAASEPQIEEIIDRALAEDLGKGDVTTEALIPGDQQGTGLIVAKKEGILAGTGAAKQMWVPFPITVAWFKLRRLNQMNVCIPGKGPFL